MILTLVGLRGMLIAAAPGTADTPRAHITNMAALECLRDIGLEEECLKVAVKGDSMLHTRWCNSLAGEEYARIYSWGNDPKRVVRLRAGEDSVLLTNDFHRVIMMLPVHAITSIFLRQFWSRF